MTSIGVRLVNSRYCFPFGSVDRHAKSYLRQLSVMYANAYPSQTYASKRGAPVLEPSIYFRDVKAEGATLGIDERQRDGVQITSSHGALLNTFQ